jgi:hypothetical protein
MLTETAAAFALAFAVTLIAVLLALAPMQGVKVREIVDAEEAGLLPS